MYPMHNTAKEIASLNTLLLGNELYACCTAAAACRTLHNKKTYLHSREEDTGEAQRSGCRQAVRFLRIVGTRDNKTHTIIVHASVGT